MSGRDKIRKAMQEADLDTRGPIFKGYSAVTQKSGWHFQSADGARVRYLGMTVSEAIRTVKATARRSGDD